MAIRPNWATSRGASKRTAYFTSSCSRFPSSPFRIMSSLSGFGLPVVRGSHRAGLASCYLKTMCEGAFLFGFYGCLVATYGTITQRIEKRNPAKGQGLLRGFYLFCHDWRKSVFLHRLDSIAMQIYIEIPFPPNSGKWRKAAKSGLGFLCMHSIYFLISKKFKFNIV